MTNATVSYDAARVGVRDDLRAAHSRFWESLARPGNWWSGAERIAIAAASRRATTCTLCRERKAAVSAGAVQGEHDSDGVLAECAVDVVHRVTTDPGRLSQNWFDAVRAGGLSEEQYVEIIGIVVALISVDAFCRGMGVPLHALPEPQSGEPDHYRPAAAQAGTGWVAMIPNGRALGAEKGLFGPGGRTANVIRAMSLVPDAVRTLLDLSKAHYLSPEEMTDLRRGRTLDRAQIELIAGRVSALRECFY